MKPDVVDNRARVLSAGQQEHLTGLITQLKTSHDLLVAFADRFSAFPGQLLPAQELELAAVRALLRRHGLTDPTGGLGTGRFADAGPQQRYDHLMHRGFANRSAALDLVSELLGETISMLDAALPRLRASDVRLVYLELYVSALCQARVVLAWSHR